MTCEIWKWWRDDDDDETRNFWKLFGFSQTFQDWLKFYPKQKLQWFDLTEKFDLMETAETQFRPRIQLVERRKGNKVEHFISLEFWYVYACNRVVLSSSRSLHDENSTQHSSTSPATAMKQQEWMERKLFSSHSSALFPYISVLFRVARADLCWRSEEWKKYARELSQRRAISWDLWWWRCWVVQKAGFSHFFVFAVREFATSASPANLCSSENIQKSFSCLYH